MKLVEFTPKHILADTAVTVGGRPLLHHDGKPVTGGQLVPGRTYALRFDEKKPNAPATIVSVQENRAARRAARRKR